MRGALRRMEDAEDDLLGDLEEPDHVIDDTCRDAAPDELDLGRGWRRVRDQCLEANRPRAREGAGHQAARAWAPHRRRAVKLLRAPDRFRHPSSFTTVSRKAYSQTGVLQLST